MPPFGPLRFLYVATDDTPRDLRYYTETLGGETVWRFQAFGADVAAVRLGEGPLVLLADHREAPDVLPVYEVADLDATEEALCARGWAPEGERFGIPNGPCLLFRDPSGNAWALFEDVRPGAMEEAYADASNASAVRE